jgi:general secretion pathway protein I
MRRSQQGFSLLEVLVAFVILALALGALMEIFSGALRNVSRSEEYQRAVLLAQSKLAAVGIETPLAEGETDGEFDSNYRWRLSIKPFQEPPAAPLNLPPQPAGAPPIVTPVIPVALLEVELRVQWSEGDQPRSVVLNTVRLANKVNL